MIISAAHGEEVKNAKLAVVEETTLFEDKVVVRASIKIILNSRFIIRFSNFDALI